MPGSSRSPEVCFGISAIGTPTRRDSFTFGPRYRPMTRPDSFSEQARRGNWKFASDLFAVRAHRMVLRHASHVLDSTCKPDMTHAIRSIEEGQIISRRMEVATRVRAVYENFS